MLAGDLSDNLYAFTGQRLDPESGLYHFHFRKYDAEVGVWTTADPSGIVFDGPNLYQYVRNNPVSFYDVLGLHTGGYGGPDTKAGDEIGSSGNSPSGAGNSSGGSNGPSGNEYPDNYIGPLPKNAYRTSEKTQTGCGSIPAKPMNSDVNHNMTVAKASWNPGWFYDQVKNSGPWDYKQQDKKYEDFGNFNYGATGHAFGFSDQVLLRAAGWASLRADPTRTGSSLGRAPYGDDPLDQQQIINGIKYSECMGY